MNKRLTFKKGLTDAIPICLGYISVSIAFGVLAVQSNMPLWAPTIISITSLSGTGQFAGLDLIKVFASFIEIACAILVINARYFLMSVSLSQRLPRSIKQWQRYFIAFGNTDEVFAVAMGQKLPLNFRYMMGLIICSLFGWTTGTVIGTFAGGLVPSVLTSAFGISLYAMFLAIIIPPATKSSSVTITIVIAALFSFLLNFTNLSSGWIIIICGVLASAFAAWKFPIAEVEDDE